MQIVYDAHSTAYGVPEPSFLQGSTSVPDQLNIGNLEFVPGACELMQSSAVFGHTFSGIVCHTYAT